MPVETSVEQAPFRLAAPPTSTSTLADWLHQGRILLKLALTALLLWNLAGWVHDFQRIQRLEAEPAPPYKVITKNEAWQRIYTRTTQFIPR